MYCTNCYNEIPAGQSFYRYQNTEEDFCSLDCLTDHLIYSHVITLETNDDESEDGDDDE